MTINSNAKKLQEEYEIDETTIYNDVVKPHLFFLKFLLPWNKLFPASHNGSFEDHKLKIWIPDTVLWNDLKEHCWYYTNPEGYLSCEKNFGMEVVESRFLTINAEENTPLAVFFRINKTLLNFTHGVHTQVVTGKNLRSILSSLHNSDLYVYGLQRYIPSSKGQVSLYRLHITPGLMNCYVYSKRMVEEKDKKKQSNDERYVISLTDVKRYLEMETDTLPKVNKQERRSKSIVSLKGMSVGGINRGATLRNVIESSVIESKKPEESNTKETSRETVRETLANKLKRVVAKIQVAAAFNNTIKSKNEGFKADESTQIPPYLPNIRRSSSKFADTQSSEKDISRSGVEKRTGSLRTSLMESSKTSVSYKEAKGKSSVSDWLQITRVNTNSIQPCVDMAQNILTFINNYSFLSYLHINDITLDFVKDGNGCFWFIKVKRFRWDVNSCHELDESIGPDADDLMQRLNLNIVRYEEAKKILGHILWQKRRNLLSTKDTYELTHQCMCCLCPFTATERTQYVSYLSILNTHDILLNAGIALSWWKENINAILRCHSNELYALQPVCFSCGRLNGIAQELWDIELEFSTRLGFPLLDPLERKEEEMVIESRKRLEIRKRVQEKNRESSSSSEMAPSISPLSVVSSISPFSSHHNTAGSVMRLGRSKGSESDKTSVSMGSLFSQRYKKKRRWRKKKTQKTTLLALPCARAVGMFSTKNLLGVYPQLSKSYAGVKMAPLSPFFGLPIEAKLGLCNSQWNYPITGAEKKAEEIKVLEGRVEKKSSTVNSIKKRQSKRLEKESEKGSIANHKLQRSKKTKSPWRHSSATGSSRSSDDEEHMQTELFLANANPITRESQEAIILSPSADIDNQPTDVVLINGIEDNKAFPSTNSFTAFNEPQSTNRLVKKNTTKLKTRLMTSNIISAKKKLMEMILNGDIKGARTSKKEIRTGVFGGIGLLRAAANDRALSGIKMNNTSRNGVLESFGDSEEMPAGWKMDTPKGDAPRTILLSRDTTEGGKDPYHSSSNFLMRHRLLIFLKNVENIPQCFLTHKDKLFLRYTLFGVTVSVPLLFHDTIVKRECSKCPLLKSRGFSSNCSVPVEGGAEKNGINQTYKNADMDVNALKAFYFFTQSHDALRILSKRQRILRIFLYFRGQKIATTQFDLRSVFKHSLERSSCTISFSSPHLSIATTTLQLAVGVTQGNLIDVRSFALKSYKGVFIPSPEYTAPEPLPVSWMEYLPRCSDRFSKYLLAVKKESKVEKAGKNKDGSKKHFYRKKTYKFPPQDTTNCCPCHCFSDSEHSHLHLDIPT